MLNRNINFIKLEDALYTAVYENNNSSAVTNAIIDECNKLTGHARCKEVIINDNCKYFFGMMVMPYLNERDISNIISRDADIEVNSYKIEIDRKLKDLLMTDKELVACLLHELGHVVTDTESNKEISRIVAGYKANMNDMKSTDRVKVYKCAEIFDLGLSLAIAKFNSIFCSNDPEILADSFAVAYGYGEPLRSGFNKILGGSSKLNRDLSPFATLEWCFKLFWEFKWKRIPAIESLMTAEKIEPSELIRRKIKHNIQSLRSSKLNCLDEYGDILITEGFMDKFKNFMNKLDIKDIRELSQELAEFSIRVKACDEEDEALYIVRELNERISILDDIIYYSDASPEAVKQAVAVKQQYENVRKELTDKKIYGEKTYGLFTKIPVVKSRYEM